MQKTLKIVALSVVLGMSGAMPAAQAHSFYLDPDASNWTKSVTSWTESGDAVATYSDGRVRLDEDRDDTGHLWTDVRVDEDEEGRYALLISYTRPEKIRTDNIAGLPYIYGYFMENDEEIIQYLQTDAMMHDTDRSTNWDVSYGIFKIPNNTDRIRFFLMQASRQGTTQDGREARFFKPGIYIVGSYDDAMDIVDEYEDERNDVADYLDDESSDDHDEDEDEDEDDDDRDYPEDDDSTPDWDTGTLLKCSSDPDVYSMESNNTLKRYPNEDTFYAWGKSFADVKSISCSTLDNYRVSGTWSYSRASYLVQFRGYPQIYTLDNGLYLRHIPDEHTARAMFGGSWQSKIKLFSSSDMGEYKYSVPHPMR